MISWLWVPVTILAAATQTARNAMQKSLTESLGVIGATQVRFLYGLPFAIVFLIIQISVMNAEIPAAKGLFWAFVLLGAVSQILATGLMLSAMRERSFTLTVAYTKTEPLQVAAFGLVVLGDPMTITGVAAIIVATAGVVLTSLKPGGGTPSGGPILLGLLSGACFAFAAIGFRGAILALGDAHFLLRATTTLAWGLAVQTAMLLVWMLVFDRGALAKSLGVWKQSLFAGFTGALASQCWFIGFALTSAANVRTLGLIEVLFAQIVSRRLFSQSMSRMELLGLGLIVIGVAMLLLAG